MTKDIKFGKEARDSLVKGVDIVANAVGQSLGPKGRNAIVGVKYGCPQIINDGVSIAKEIELKDPLENAGAQLLKEVSAKTNDAAGDGTTTASVLAQAIIHGGLDLVEKGANPIQLKDGIDQATLDAVKFIKQESKKVDEKSLEQVATISAGNNTEIGKLIADAIKSVGDDGIVTVEESKTTGTTLKQADGLVLDKGYISPYFITDPTRMEAVLENPCILLVNKKVNLLTDILPILEVLAKQGRSLLLIAEDVEGEALGVMVVNAMKKVIRTVAVKAPGFGDIRKNILHDIGLITGATVWEEELAMPLADINLQFLGKANRVVVKKDETTIVVDDVDKQLVEDHIKNLKTELQNAKSEYDKEKLQERIAKLSGGVAVIQVGAVSEVELRDRKLRIEDALNATKAAKEEGIVAGGGFTLLKAKQHLKDLINGIEPSASKASIDRKAGYQLLVDSLDVPLRKIAQNAGLDAQEIVTNCLEKDLGYNALTDNYENLLETGVIDPAKVTRSVVENASSIAGMLLTTETSIVDEPIQLENTGFVPQGTMMM